jgi:hypothetical protein
VKRIALGAAFALAAVALAAAATRDAWLPFAALRWREGADVEVVATGDEPRELLAYRFTEPPRPFTLLLKAGTARIRGGLPPEEAPGPPVSLRFEPTSPAFHFGVSRVVWRIVAATTGDDPEVAPRVRDETDGAARRLVGRAFTVRIGPHGEVAIDAPPPADPSEERLLEAIERVFAVELAPPLPTVPVGRGAHWTAHRTRPLGVATEVDWAIDLTLADVDADAVDLRIATALSADPQPAPPTPGSSANAVIDQVDGRLAGQVVRSTREATPLHSDLELDAVLGLTEVGPVGPSADGERSHGYKLVVRSHEAMQADALGPIEGQQREHPDAGATRGSP